MSPQIKKLTLLKSLLEGDTSALVEPIVDLDARMEAFELKDWTGPQGEDGKDGRDGVDGYNPDPTEVANLVLKQIPIPKDGKDGKDAVVDEGKLVKKILKQIPVPKDGKDADPTQIIQGVIKQIPTETPLQIKEKLETLAGEERLDASAIKGLPAPQDFVDYFEKLDQGVKNRVMGSNFVSRKGPVDQRWHGAGSGSAITLETNGVVNGSQTVLNLIAGTNVTLTDNGLGGVTIDSSGGGGESLAQTLAIGNVTGGNDIVVSTGDIIVGQTSLTLSDSGLNNYYFAGPSYLFQQWYNGAVTDFLLQGGGTQLYSDTAIDIQTATGLYGFYGGTNKSGIFDFSAITANDRTLVWRDLAGTVALLSDIPSVPITAVSDTATVDLTITGTTLSADVIKQMSITSDASGLKLDGDALTPGNSQYYGTDGAGTKGFFALPSGTPGGADTNVQFNDGGTFGGDADFTWNKTSNALSITGTITTSGAIRSNTSFILEESGVGTDIITIQAPASIAASYTLTLPTDDGGSNQFLQTDGAGVLSWATALTSLSIGQAITSGTANRVLYENASNALDEDAGFTFTEATNTLGIGEVGNGGEINLVGGTSGTVTIQTAAAAGTWSLTLPTTDGNANEFLQTNGSGVTTWAAAYFPGGTDVALADGGTGASLTDPNADRILFWDDSAGQVTWLTPGTGLSITTTTINSTVTPGPKRMRATLISFGAAGTEASAGKFDSTTTPATPTDNNIPYIDMAAAGQIVVSGVLPDSFTTGDDIKIRLVYSSTVPAAQTMNATLDGSSAVLDPVGNNAVSANMAHHDNDASVALTIAAADSNKTYADATFEVTNASGVFDDGSDTDVTSAAGQVITTTIKRTDGDTETLRIYTVEYDWS